MGKTSDSILFIDANIVDAMYGAANRTINRLFLEIVIEIFLFITIIKVHDNKSRGTITAKRPILLVSKRSKVKLVKNKGNFK